jgi:hypothetical protein
MKLYKFFAGKSVAFTTDEIMAKFMNKKLSFIERVILWLR